MKNKMSDLNNHLFSQLERLADESMDAEKIEQEVKRAEAIVAVADQLTGNYSLQLKAAKLYADHGPGVLQMLPQIGQSSSEPKQVKSDGDGE